MQLGGQQDISLGGHLRWGREGRLNHTPTLPGISASNRARPARMRRHFRAIAAAEDSTLNVHFRATPRVPGIRYLRLTDLVGVDDISASGKSYR